MYKLGEESLGSVETQWRVTPARGNSRESATENNRQYFSMIGFDY